MASRSPADVGVALRTATEKYGALKQAFDANDLPGAEAQIAALKSLFLQFPSFLEPNAITATKQQEVLLVREVLEIAVYVCARKRDLEAFDQNYAILRSYYTPEFDVGVASERRLVVVGLRLMRLLVGSNLPAFHAELELVPRADQQQLYVKYPAQLERFLAEGSYNKLLHAQSKAPSAEYSPLVAMLESTVRHEIATCIPVSYDRLTLAAAKSLLMLDSDEAVMDTARAHKWPQEGGVFVFNAATSKVETVVPFKSVLGHQLKLAVHLQSVV